MSVHRHGLTDVSGFHPRPAGFDDCELKCNVIFVHGLKGHPKKTWGAPKNKVTAATPSVSKWRVVRSLFQSKSSTNSGEREFQNETSADVLSISDSTPSVTSCSPPSIISFPSSVHSSSTFTASAVPSTATDTDGRFFWPADLLAIDASQARIWTYGYIADVLAGMFQMNNKNSVSQHGRDLAARLERDLGNDDPIIFVAHSLGGIIVKDALHRSEFCQRLTKNIIFLGTPHRGSTLAGWGGIASNLARLVGQDPNSKSLKALEVNSEVLENIHEEFKTIVHIRGIKIHTFQEARGMQIMKGIDHKVVDDVSSKADFPRSVEIVESIDADHMQMAKCGSRSDDSYRAIYGVIKQFICNLPEKQTSSSKAQDPNHLNCDNARSDQLTTQGPPQISCTKSPEKDEHSIFAPKFLVPYNRNPDCIERTTTMKKIRELFGHCETSSPVQKRSRVALHGLGGVGKTQIALSYVYWLQEYCPSMSIFWVHASSTDRFRHAYANIAKECNIVNNDDSNADSLELVKAYLESKESSPWTLVIDNADDAELFFQSTLSSRTWDGVSKDKTLLGQYIPECGHGSVLITTRNKAVGVKLAPGRPPIEVDKMDEDEAGQLIRVILLDSEIPAEECMALASKLEFLPICIAQAAAFILENTISIDDYIELLDDSDQALVERLSEPFETMGRDSEMPHAVAATWVISFDQIRRQCGLASDFLSFICLFSRQAIPKDFILEYYDETRGKIGATEKVEIAKALGVLKAFSFISEAKDKSMSIHRLVQLVTRKWLLNEDRLSEFASQALYILSIHFPHADDDTIRTCTNYMPHVHSVLQYGDPSSVDDRRDRARILHNVGTFYIHSGQHELCENTQKECIEILDDVLGSDHDETLACRETMSTILSALYREDEAERFELEVLEARIKKYGQDHPDTLKSRSGLAHKYMLQGRYKESETLFLQVIEQSKKVQGEDHLDTLEHMEKLARLYSRGAVGRLEEAAHIWAYVVKKREKKQGLTHADTLDSMSMLARAHERLENYDEALRLAIVTYEKTKAKYDIDHDATLERSGHVADLYSLLARPDLAEPLRRWQYQCLREKYGAHHQEAERTCRHLARAYSEMGRFDEAETLFAEQLDRYEAAKGADHPKTLLAMESLAELWAKQGRYAEAFVLGEEGLERSTAALGIGASRTKSIANNLQEWRGWRDNGTAYMWDTLLSEEYASIVEQSGTPTAALSKLAMARLQHSKSAGAVMVCR